MGLQMNVGAIFSVTRAGFEARYSNANLRAARDHGFVRPEPGAAEKVKDWADFAQLAREAKHRRQLSPGFGRGQAINQITKVVNFRKGKRVGRHIPGHGRSGRALEGKIGAQTEPRDEPCTKNQESFWNGKN